jgi:hypothetical protein
VRARPVERSASAGTAGTFDALGGPGADERWEVLPASTPALAEPPEPPRAPALAGAPPAGSPPIPHAQHPPRAESPYSSVSSFAPSALLPPGPGTPGAAPPPPAKKRPPPPPPGAATALGILSALNPQNISPQSSPPADAHWEEDVHAPDGLREPRKERKGMFWNRDRDRSKERDKGKGRDVETPLPADLVRMIGEHPRPMSLSSSFHNMPSILFLGLLTQGT